MYMPPKKCTSLMRETATQGQTAGLLQGQNKNVRNCAMTTAGSCQWLMVTVHRGAGQDSKDTRQGRVRAEEE